MDEGLTKTNLEKFDNLIIVKVFINRCSGNSEFSAVIALVYDIFKYAILKTKTIIRHMPEFTLHDEEHIFNMLIIAGKLIPTENFEKISVPDIMMIILSILLHDIGMCPEENLVKAWKGLLDEEETEAYKNEILQFKKFHNGKEQELKQIQQFLAKEDYAKAQYIEEQIITNYIRQDHASRARRMIAEDWNGKIRFMGTDLTPELADICASHAEKSSNLLEFETLKLCYSDIYLCTPFVAVILRLSDIIDFDRKRAPQTLFKHLSIRNQISIAEWKKHLSVNAWSITPEFLAFSAQCEHPAIEASIRDFCDQIDEELKNCSYILSHINSNDSDISCYKLKLPSIVDRKRIAAIKDVATGKPIYKYHNTKFTLSKKQVIDLLMGTKLYGKPDVALRELIQNSIDACLLRQELSIVWGEKYIPSIKIDYYSDDGIDYIAVIDNGIGMNQHIIDNYYTNLGKSYYTSQEFAELLYSTQTSYKPISKFGIGILSCFMVSDDIHVKTRRLEGQNQYGLPMDIFIEGYDSLFYIKEGDLSMPIGTTTILKLREMHPWEKMHESKFIQCIKDLVPLPPFTIQINSNETKEEHTYKDFETLTLNLERDYSWDQEENIRILEVDLDNKEYEFKGKANIAFIAKQDGTPLDSIETGSIDIMAEDESYTLSSDITYNGDCLVKRSDGLEIDENGELYKNSSTTSLCKSGAKISIHGINIPCNLFLSYPYDTKTILDFPLPIRMRLDIGGDNDLTLNSVRTLIIPDDNWLKFESRLVKTLLNKIEMSLDIKDWVVLKKIMFIKTDNKDLKSYISS